MGFGVCTCCGGHWCSVNGFVNYCICKHGASNQEMAYAKGWQKWWASKSAETATRRAR